MSERAIVTTGGAGALERFSDLGQAANEAAASNVFADYRQRMSANTTRQQDEGLAVFSRFLVEVAGQGPAGEALATTPAAWQGVTWGIVTAFREWLLKQGYAIATVNARLTTVRRYASLAHKAGVLGDREAALISTVEGYSRKDALNLDEKRRAANVPVRVGHKKAEPVGINAQQAQMLKGQPDTPQGIRDRLLVCLLLDHGLRCSEVAGAMTDDVDTEAGTFAFYRPKVKKSQTHTMTPGTLEAAQAWEQYAESGLQLLRGSRKGGALTAAGMSPRAITKRIKDLGEAAGIEGLSPHDLRHYWATQAARSGTPLDRLRQAGGWNSLAMPLRYIEDAEIANEGVILETSR